jgi:hypothetical protein
MILLRFRIRIQFDFSPYSYIFFSSEHSENNCSIKRNVKIVMSDPHSTADPDPTGKCNVDPDPLFPIRMRNFRLQIRVLIKLW